MKEKLISPEDIRNLHPIFRGRFGNILIKMLFRIAGIDKVNAVYDASKHKSGLEYVDDMLDNMGIIRKVENDAVLDSLQGASFITVSNHPYGHIDGIIAISVVARKRSDFKMMVNWMLSRIDTMEEFFIGVNPYSKDNKMSAVKSSVSGIRQCLEHLREGHPLGLFPAGGVSDSSWTKTEDREWQTPVLKLIQKAKTTVVPMFISGSNSWIYRLLGMIDWRLRMVRLMHEVANKKGKVIYVRFGQPITVEEQSKYANTKDLGEFLKRKTYDLS
ncbi:MAG: lysophospholipid acyltransferase family protein [Candidatus Azobacteroides sp.]|nr:lysophospholipid acyltransferase family protein [Candidatus Azobacteroides sp.]